MDLDVLGVLVGGVEVRFGLRWGGVDEMIFSHRKIYWPAEVFKGKERWGLG